MNQLHGSQREESLWLDKDLLAIRMASVNPILDPWIYILLRKTVVLKLMEKIKCLFCKMCGQSNGRQCRCADSHLSSSIVSRDCPSLVSREIQEMVSTSQIFLYPSEGPPRLSFQARSQCGSSSQAGDIEGTQRGVSQNDMEDAVPSKTLNELPMDPKNSTLHVSFTAEVANTQEKCI